MSKRHPRVDAHVARSPEFAKPILSRVRQEVQVAFDTFSPSHKREYIEWITEAKSDETRTRRLAQAIEWIAQGKSHNWKYERKHVSPYFGRSIRTMCEFSRERSNTMCFPSGVTSNVPKVPRLLRRVS